MSQIVNFTNFSYMFRPWPQFVKWLRKMATEYVREGDLTMAAGLPVTTELYDRKKCNIGKYQRGLMLHIVKPYAEVFITSIICDHHSVLLEHLDQNLIKLQTVDNKEVTWEPEEVNIKVLLPKIIKLGSIQETTFKWGALHLRVMEASGLNSQDYAGTTARCKSSFAFLGTLDSPPAGHNVENVIKQVGFTRRIKNCCNPVWNEDFSFVVPLPFMGCKIELNVMNEKIGGDVSIGKVMLDLPTMFPINGEGVVSTAVGSGWHYLIDDKGKPNRGKVFILAAIEEATEGKLQPHPQNKKLFEFQPHPHFITERTLILDQDFTGTSSDLQAVIDSEEEITVCVGTWNVGEAPPPAHANFHSWLKPGCHIYAVGTQENTNSDWTENLVALLNEDVYLSHCDYTDRYILYKTESISYFKGRTRIILQLDVIGLASTFKHVNNLKTYTENTGAAGIVANKGGVVCTFNVRDVSFCFVTCHLAAHQNKQAHRNANVREIINGTGSFVSKENTKIDLDIAYDYAFWCGDLNYRVDFGEGEVGMTPSDSVMDEVVNLIERRNFNRLLQDDQLIRERANGRVFNGWLETPPDFEPTFKVKVGDSKFSYKNQRLPAYCDRVLWKTAPNRPIFQQEYNATPVMNTSDHKPVYAVFKIPVFDCPPSRVSNFDAASLTILKCDVELKQPEKGKLSSEVQVSFFADFLLASCKGAKKKTTELSNGDVSVSWNKDEFMTRGLMVNSPARLEICRLYFAVCEPGKFLQPTVALCVLGMKDAAYGKVMSFNEPLTRLGMVVGTVKGELQISSVKGSLDDFEDDAQLGDLFVHAIGAKNVPKMDMTSEREPFLTVTYKDKEGWQTKTVHDKANPTWNDQFNIGSITADMSLNDEVILTLYDYDSIAGLASRQKIGEMTHTIGELLMCKEDQPYEIAVASKQKGLPCQLFVNCSIRGKAPASWHAALNKNDADGGSHGLG